MKSKATKIAVPRSLEMAIVKIRAELELDWDEACEHMAGLADPNGKKFKSAVSREANRRYKSRHLVELNKAKKTFTDKGYKKGVREGHSKGHQEGYGEGLATGKTRHQIWYYCKGCKKKIHIEPNDKCHKALIQYMNDHGWAHSSCLP